MECFIVEYLTYLVYIIEQIDEDENYACLWVMSPRSI